ncbi:hypothetical protein MAR_033150 [Mya arenaria]|uniref:Uncharacterized protein n=1 Tax=Mya arenaria TaxID=6604 RepID=A0ABY7GBJ1_MYAAR|nr:hypothetical protein MAR_033150 [Mya arenaria]
MYYCFPVALKVTAISLPFTNGKDARYLTDRNIVRCRLWRVVRLQDFCSIYYLQLGSRELSKIEDFYSRSRLTK